jgi:hypothetical protein
MAGRPRKDPNAPPVPPPTPKEALRTISKTLDKLSADDAARVISAYQSLQALDSRVDATGSDSESA